MDLCFRGVTSRIQGATFFDFQFEQELIAKLAWNKRKPISPGGLHKFVHGQEYHAFNPDVVAALQTAVKSGDYGQYQEYAAFLVNNRQPATLRDLMAIRPGITPIALSDVEAVEHIFPRFDSAAMSLGALSPEAHESLAIAMNRLGDDPFWRGRGKMWLALWNGKAFQDQAGGFRTLRGYTSLSEQCRSHSDKSRSGCQARRGWTVAGWQSE